MLPAVIGFGWARNAATARIDRIDRIDRWSSAEREVLASMTPGPLPPPPSDPSNAFADRPEAAALGRQLFVDTRLSRDGKVSCASCHDPQRQFQDDRPVGQGAGTGVRRTMPVPATAHGTWLFWDGRKDSLWSQALGPLEDGSNRTRLVQQLQAHHRAAYEAGFGPFPMIAKLPADTGPSARPRSARPGRA